MNKSKPLYKNGFKNIFISIYFGTYVHVDILFETLYQREKFFKIFKQNNFCDLHALDPHIVHDNFASFLGDI